MTSPTPDPDITSQVALKLGQDFLDLTSLRARLDAAEATITDLRAQLAAAREQAPTGA